MKINKNEEVLKLNELKNEVNALYVQAVNSKCRDKKSRLMGSCQRLLKEYGRHKEWVQSLPDQ